MRALVTGATGFIGRALTEALLARGYATAAFVRSRERARALEEAGARLIVGDLTDRARVSREMPEVEVVFHAAGLRPRGGLSGEAYQRGNVEATRNLLEASAGRVGRFVHCSSVGVVGSFLYLPVDEGHPYAPIQGHYHYHRTKREAEQMVLAWGARTDLPATVVRPSITYGPGDGNGMVTRLIALVAQRRFLFVGTGQNRVHLVYLTDLVRGLLRAGESVSGRSDGIYIVAGAAPITVRSLVEQIASALGVPGPRGSVPLGLAYGLAALWEGACGGQARCGLRRLGAEPFLTRSKVWALTADRVFDISRAQRDLGYQPEVDYAEGIRKTVRWGREQGLI